MARKVDVYVGRRIRHRRWLIDISQQELAERVGLRFQQIQKYETGSNRVSASKLWEISRVLNVPVEYFFKGQEQDDTEREYFLDDRNAVLLVASYYKIPEEKRKSFFEMAAALARQEP